ncbi:16S rRNA (cytidine1402-2'-O)-methyltransferase [Dysgonomonas sp. PH5-45]|uniref:SAM-dependent methyltransferase n=1 Tax=unclassified Dysgonomonas TaxID=2630389 RepID=UPI002473358C|nr:MULTISPECIES: SAM-dependent methyltransferase [unclassified Dysgonomonas]MDH6354042.1 16S rRNA (cytidine1402-2'-O)-methyltransferase [Dysgonomonas sp. PH5-45]MDH6386944.1 16S rRNA (cytidine1402-2'-O)-methyltransferase [Dysgonomonas sp. PH5-37]
MQASLYLIPVTLGETPVGNVLPSYNKEIILTIKHFVVENVRSARRFLKKTDQAINIDELTFYELNKHTDARQIETYLQPIGKGFHVGVISEAGCPAIADPGADIVAIAQRKNIRVIPLVGPSSILMSLMASGFNGQSFAFHGYLPIETADRIKKIKQLEQRIYSEHQTQIFIETPYRNTKLVEDIVRNCTPSTKLCIAMNITCEDEFIKTLPVKDWAKQMPDMGKKPCIFLIYK